MATSTKLTISGLKIHGSGVASCGSYPDVKISVTVEFTRENPNDTTIKWKVTSINWSHPWSGTFGFKFRCYLYLSTPNAYYGLLMKNNTTASNWWKAVTLNKPSGSFTAGSDKPTISVSIRMHGGSESCTSGSDHHLCYGSSTYRNIKTYTVTLPKYEPFYTVHYNNNGGQGNIADQIKQPGEPLVLTTDTPNYPVSITYHDDEDNSITTYKHFNDWLCSADSQLYDPGDDYLLDANCDMTAQWGTAPFTPQLPTKYIRLTYETNGGVLTPSYRDVPKASLGYDPDPETTSSPEYPNGVECYTSSNSLDLYPVYGPAVIPVSELPVPTKSGSGFRGWYYDEDLTNPVVSEIVTDTDITIYAKWQILPIHKFDGSWGEANPYVWVCTDDGTKQWEQTAPIYQFDYFNNAWINISAGSPPPYGIFNYPNGPWAVTGLRQSFADGLEQKVQQGPFYISDTIIRRVGDGNVRLTFGATCYKGAYRTLCMDAEVVAGWGHYPAASVGIRYTWHGDKGQTYTDEPDMDIRYSLVDWREPHHNYDHTEPWTGLSRQIVKFDLSQVTQDPFYLLIHACDRPYYIYSIWLE